MHKLDAEIAAVVIAPRDRGILAFLQTIGVSAAEVEEVAREFLVNPIRARAMAVDLGWTARMAAPTSHRGFADAAGNYSPALYEAAQRQARARHEAKRATRAARKARR